MSKLRNCNNTQFPRQAGHVTDWLCIPTSKTTLWRTPKSKKWRPASPTAVASVKSRRYRKRPCQRSFSKRAEFSRKTLIHVATLTTYRRYEIVSFPRPSHSQSLSIFLLKPEFYQLKFFSLNVRRAPRNPETNKRKFIFSNIYILLPSIKHQIIHIKSRLQHIDCDCTVISSFGFAKQKWNRKKWQKLSQWAGTSAIGVSWFRSPLPIHR